MSKEWCNGKLETDIHDMPLKQIEQLICCCSNSRNAHAECPVKPLVWSLPLLQDGEMYPESPRADVCEADEAENRQEQEQQIVEDAGEKKKKLHATVAAFVKKAVAGFEVEVVDPETFTVTESFFLMDSRLTMFSLKAKSEIPAAQVQQDYNITDILSVYRRQDVAGRAFELAGMAKFCVGMDIVSVSKRVFFLFDSAVDEDEFFTSIKILRLSMIVSKAR
jgi:hypothetical protein